MRRAFRPLLPQGFDAFVCRLKFSDRRSPVRKQRVLLCGGALFARNRQRGSDKSGKRIGDRSGTRCCRDAEATEVVIHVVVAVPTAVHLLERDFQHGPIFIRDRLLKNEDRVARLIASARSSVDAPRGVVLAVDRECNGAGDSAFVGLVEEVRFEHSFGV